MNEDLSIVVIGHDSYKDCVVLFEEMFSKAWKECPYDVYWSNGVETLESDYVHVLNNGADATGCERLLHALNTVTSEFVLFVCEDYLPGGYVDSTSIAEDVAYLRETGAVCCKLIPTNTKNMTRDMAHPQLYHMRSNQPYALSLLCSIFRTDYLKGLILDSKWSGWELEAYGLRLAKENKLHGFIYDDRDVWRGVHLISKGRIIPEAWKRLQNDGVDLSGMHREMLPNSTANLNKLKGFFSSICPAGMRGPLKRVGKLFHIRFTSDD